MSKELNEALEALYKAWAVDGSSDAARIVTARELHYKWPELAGAISTFCARYEKERT